MNTEDLMRAKVQRAIIAAADEVSAKGKPQKSYTAMMIVALSLGVITGATSTLGGMYIGLETAIIKSGAEPVTQTDTPSNALPNMTYTRVPFSASSPVSDWEAALNSLRNQQQSLMCTPNKERPGRGFDELCRDSKYF